MDFLRFDKDIFSNCPSFRPILSTINSVTYKKGTFLVIYLTSNEYTVKDTFAFPEENVEQDP